MSIIVTVSYEPAHETKQKTNKKNKKKKKMILVPSEDSDAQSDQSLRCSREESLGP